MQSSKKHNLILIGAPGSGKGTQCEFIKNEYGLAHLSTGDMLREAIKNGTKIGLEAKSIMDSGKFVGDDIVLGLVKEKFDSGVCVNGFVLDGFPRTILQAEGLAKILSEIGDSLTHVIYFDIDDSEIIERISGRCTHPPSGRIYHVKFNPPKQPGIDDATGEPLVWREDDNAEAVKVRLDIFHKQTAPLVKFYEELGILRKVDAKLPPKEVTEQIKKILGN
ncbi:adenylate kinase [Cryptosporidium ubiquitum]|uniref:Adenylate kinase n=1 Tax=Cryptosporidium ubiquitum TaxID=857276 RepID=A0A1J4MN18_9CRYT|nr:adenylate kinase [Cryptosporidium ubiquitum]OII75582.1 adenylate kinase [Cryptosporidium ubiquitum]